MTRTWKWLAAATPLALAAACTNSSKAPAEAALAAASTAVDSLQGDAARYAPDEVKAVMVQYSTVKDTMANKDYPGVILYARDIPAHAREVLARASAAKASLQESWTRAGDEVAKALDAARRRIEVLNHARKLPAGMDPATVARAEASLATLQAGWVAAARQHDAGDLPGAVTQAGQLRTRALDLERSLGSP
jgi:hypothetical protein